MAGKLYPRGQIALGSGDLIDVTKVSVTHTNNAKQVHTIRQKGAGFTTGTEETTVSFDMAISAEGQERDYFKSIKKALGQKLRVKIPGETMTINGVFKDRNFELPLDGEITASLMFIGHMED